MSKMREDAASILGISEDKLETHPDFMFVSKPEVLDDIEDIITKSSLKPMGADQTVIIIEGIDHLSSQGQNKLLKPFEDYTHVVFLVSDTGEGEILQTIRSRLVFVDMLESYDESNIEGVLNGYVPTDECLETLKEIVKCIDEKKTFRKPLHLLSSSDKNNFFTLYGKNGVLALFSLMSAIFYAYSLKVANIIEIKTPSKLSGDYTLFSLKAVNKALNECIEKLNKFGYAYTKSELFRDIINIEQALARKEN